MSATTEELLLRIAEGGGEEGKAANELLSRYAKGDSVLTLTRLLEHSDDAVATTGAWISSELGHRALPLLPTLERLLHHRESRVRFFAVDTIWGAGADVPAELTGMLFACLRDPESPVRWKTGMFLKRAPLERIEEAAKQVPDTDLSRLAVWLVTRARDRDVKAILDGLVSESSTMRFVAAIAAATIASIDPRPLKAALASDDDEVRSFAQDCLDLG